MLREVLFPQQKKNPLPNLTLNLTIGTDYDDSGLRPFGPRCVKAESLDPEGRA